MQDQTGSTPEKLKPPHSYSELEKLLNAFALVYGKPNSDEAIAAYADALSHLSDENVRLAFRETFRRHRSSFPPTPGEILAYLEQARAELPPVAPTAHSRCPKCLGTGYELIPVPDSDPAYGYKWAVSCSCRNDSTKASGTESRCTIPS